MLLKLTSAGFVLLIIAASLWLRRLSDRNRRGYRLR